MHSSYRLLPEHGGSGGEEIACDGVYRQSSRASGLTPPGRQSLKTASWEIRFRRCMATIDTDGFKHFIAAVIFASLVVLAGETDYEEWGVWPKLDAVILFIFFVEVVLHMLNLGIVSYFLGGGRFWNVLEFVIVFLGIMEVCLWLFSSIDQNSPMLHNLRLTRLLRLLRLFRLVKPLMSLATAYKTMLESFAVVFTVLFILLLVNGIFCTSMLGHGGGLDFDDPLVQKNLPDIQFYFRDLFTSMFSLFQVCTLDNWIDIAQPVLNVDIRWRFFFIFFIPIGSWTMISILAAVASESVVESAMGRAENQKKEEEEIRKAMTNSLREAFLEADSDGNGLLDKEEFISLIHKDEVIDKIRGGSSESTGSFSPEEMMSVWDSLDSNRTGELTIDEFVSGFALLSEGLAAKHIATFDYNLQKACLKVLKRIELLNESMIELRSRNTQLLSDLRQQVSRRKKFEMQFRLWRTYALQQSPNAEIRAALEQLEEPPRTSARTSANH